MKKGLKKLTLSRETLADLSHPSLRVAGGATGTGGGSDCSWCPTCESCTGKCCPP